MTRRASIMEGVDPLPREEVVKALTRRNPSRIPCIQTRWWGEGFEQLHGDALREFDRYPEDAGMIWIQPIDLSRMHLSWPLPEARPHDAAPVIDEWAKLDEFIGKLPDPARDPQFEAAIRLAERHKAEDRYSMVAWWRLFFERPWTLRGMEQLMVDYYTAPEQVHRLLDALGEQYARYLRTAADLLRPDGFWTSDDLGHQTGAMIGDALFAEFIRPYYRMLGALLRSLDLHWWLHSCGDNTAFLPAFIDAGVTVFHPVQRGAMDPAVVARAFGDKLVFLAGIDVQDVLPNGSPEDVRREVRFLVDTFDAPGGGMCIAAGNGILPGTPLENIGAFLDEALRYGAMHRERYRRADACR